MRYYDELECRVKEQVHQQSVPNKTTITINSYTVYVAPNDQRVVVAKMPKFEIDRKYFREVKAT
jgi:hypothetical protein